MLDDFFDNIVSRAISFRKKHPEVRFYPMNERVGLDRIDTFIGDSDYETYSKKVNSNVFGVCPIESFDEYKEICNGVFKIYEYNKHPYSFKYETSEQFGKFRYPSNSYEIIKRCHMLGDAIILYNPATVCDISTEPNTFKYENSWSDFISLCNEWIDYWENNLKGITKLKYKLSRWSEFNKFTSSVVLEGASIELTSFINRLSLYYKVESRESYCDEQNLFYVDSINIRELRIRPYYYNQIQHKYDKMYDFFVSYFEDVTGHKNIVNNRVFFKETPKDREVLIVESYG